jgi:hypothetical protein
MSFMRTAMILLTGNALSLLLVSYFISQHKPLPHRPQAQSWDQGNLQHLAPPPTAGNPCPGVFDAPGGELRFCQ